jgi:hypothetical protein
MQRATPGMTGLIDMRHVPWEGWGGRLEVAGCELPVFLHADIDLEVLLAVV